MLKLAKERAEALKSAKFDKVKEIEKKMTDEKNKNYDSLRTPNSFYCTFANDVSIFKAL